jgi:hypothetical protein
MLLLLFSYLVYVIYHCVAADIDYDSSKNQDMEFIRALGRECSDNYPETLHMCMITPG